MSTSTTTNVNVQPSTSSRVAVVLTESLRPSSTQAASTILVPHSTRIITVAVLASISVVIGGVALVGTIAIVIYRKPRRRINLGRNDSMISNAIYGTTPENMAAMSRRGDTYDYPRFGLRLLKSIRGKRLSPVDNNTRVAALEDEPGNVHSMDSSSQRNEAYGASSSSIEDDFEYSYVRYL